jgi:mannose-1-phosphate guanylyltransferase
VRIGVVMSGGRGTRFWPLSRARKPKQLVPLIDGRCLLDLTIDRIRPIFGPDAIWVVTQEAQLEETQAAVGLEPIKALCEPVGKNTAPCIAYVACQARAEFGDATLAVFPADHLVADVDGFRDVVKAGLEFVETSGSILTIGIMPDRPATGFGYIERGAPRGGTGGFEFYGVRRFVEKPAAEAARRYVEDGTYLWNAGIFVFKASDMLAEMEKYLPQIASSFCEYGAAVGTAEESRKKSEAYSSAGEISIDYGVMEKTSKACVVPADIGWEDLGNWDSFSRYLPRDESGNAVRGELVDVDTANCIVYSERQVVAALGVEDLIVIATDDAILITRRDRGEEVKKLVDQLAARGLKNLL